MALTLIRAKAGPFQGIDTSRPVVIEFPKVSKNVKKRPITILGGKEGLGKSSFIHFLLYMTKQNLGIKKEDLVNIDANALNGEIEFRANDETWKVVVTKTTFKLFRFFEIDKNNNGWIPQGSEDTTLKKLIGNVAISPMKLKVDDGKKQIDWLFKMLNVPESIIQQAKSLSGRIETVGESRAKSRKDYEYLKKHLNEDPMFVNWEQSEKKYKEVKTIETVKEKFEVVTRNKNRVNEGKDKLLRIGRNIEEKNKEIEELQRKVALAETELKDLEETKKKGEAFVLQNAAVEAEYQAVEQEFMTISTYLAEQNAWKLVQQKKDEMDDFEDLIQRANTSEATLKTQKRSLLKKILPDIEGLEIFTEESIEGVKPGIYLHGKNPTQLSESELFDLYFKLCKAQGVTMVVIENITSFGTNVVETLNELARAGVYVWATEMRRDQKELRIEFVDQIT